MQRRTIRTAALGLAGLGIVAFVGYSVVFASPERLALEAHSARLDGVLVQRRAVLADLARSQVEHAQHRAALDALQAQVAPPLDALRSVLRSTGAELVLTSSQTVGDCLLQELRVRAHDRPALAAVMGSLDASSASLRVSHVRVDPSGSSELRIQRCAIPPPSRLPSPVELRTAPTREAPWYAPAYAGLEASVRRKQEELARLDRAGGAVFETPSLLRALHAHEEILTGFAHAHPDAGQVLRALLIDAPPILAHGTLTAREAVVVVEGAPATALDRAALVERLSPGIEIVRYRSGPPLELTLRARRASAAGGRR